MEHYNRGISALPLLGVVSRLRTAPEGVPSLLISTSANTCSENKMACMGEHPSLFLAQSFAMFWYKTVVNNGEPETGGRYVLIGCRIG